MFFKQAKPLTIGSALEAFGAQVASEAVAPLMSDGPPGARLAAMLNGIGRVYHEGSDLCLFALLSVGEAGGLFKAAIRPKLMTLLQALTQTLQEAGLRRDGSEAEADEFIVLIEGSLIVAGILGDAGVFTRTLHRLQNRVETMSRP